MLKIWVLNCGADGTPIACMQVAAVLANMSASDSCRQEVVKHGGINVLLRFLQVGARVLSFRMTFFAVSFPKYS